MRQGAPDQFASSAAITVHPDGELDLTGGSSFGSLTMTGGTVSNVNAGSNRLNGDITILPSAAGSRITGNGAAFLSLASGTRTITVGDGAAVYDLDFGLGLSTGTAIKAGPGTLRMAGTGTTSYAVVIEAGTVALATNAALGIGTPTFAGGILVADGGDRTLANTISVTGNFTVGASVDGTPRAFTFGGPTGLAAGVTLTVSNPALTTWSGVLSGPGAVLKTGPGTLRLTRVNSFTGGITVTGGMLSVAGAGSLGATTGVVTLNGSQLLFTANTTTTHTIFANGSTIVPAVGTTLSYGSGSIVNGGFLDVGGTHAFTDGSALNGTTTAQGGSLTQRGNVTFTNTFLRGTLTQAAAAVLTANNAILSGAGSVTVNGTVNATNFESNGLLTINPGGTVSNGGTVLVLAGGSRTFLGTVGTPGGTLAATGGTTIELNGGLLVNNGTQTGALNVNFGGVAKGAGTFGTVTVGDGGRFSPGNSPGTAIVSGLTFGSGGRYDFELNGANATPGNGADFLNVLGNLHITAGTTPNSVFTIAITSLNGSNQQAALGDFDPRQSYTLTLATAAGGITGFSANEFVVDTGAFGNSLQGGNFTVLLSGNSLQLQFTPVPEPAALSALVVGVAVVGCVRRRVRRSRLTTST